MKYGIEKGVWKKHRMQKIGCQSIKHLLFHTVPRNFMEYGTSANYVPNVTKQGMLHKILLKLYE